MIGVFTTITCTIIVVVIAGLVALITILARPTVAVNHYITVPLPGRPAQKESPNNIVIVAKQLLQ
jgi:Flp pilus assembly protein CpaB